VAYRVAKMESPKLRVGRGASRDIQHSKSEDVPALLTLITTMYPSISSRRTCLNRAGTTSSFPMMLLGVRRSSAMSSWLATWLLAGMLRAIMRYAPEPIHTTAAIMITSWISRGRGRVRKCCGRTATASLLALREPSNSPSRHFLGHGYGRFRHLHLVAALGAVRDFPGNIFGCLESLAAPAARKPCHRSTVKRTGERPESRYFGRRIPASENLSEGRRFG
jgi:hypothetical protein